ncbi:MAG: Ldh family oxidoreductase [Candidatus Bathyarchaeota archaeon]|nr:Ldh family oxidoreductase [Candidatus Bathyarchaeota archaeon]
MPTFDHGHLNGVCFHILHAAGVPEEEARIVAEHLVKSNLVGHDSHGVILLPVYIERIKRGHIVPGAPFEVVRETPTTACINGHWGFGFVVTEKAMRMAMEKARAHNAAAVTVFYQSHVGRLGHYSAMAAREGMIALVTADSGAGRKSVVPFGGREVRLGTNPLSIAIPSDLEGPAILDMATCTVAGGKLNVARARGQRVPQGLIIDEEGNPTTDPFDVLRGGGILPLGGSQGHKGYGLSFMVEILSGILTGLGFGTDPEVWRGRHGLEHRHNDGCFMAVFNVAAFRPLAEFKEEVAAFAGYVKSSPPARGFREVLYPGEPEWLTEQRRRGEGIFVEDDTWERIAALIREYKLEDVIGGP